MSTPLISVVIPAYNRAAFIGETIDGILHQSEQDFELIIFNNGSTDDTESVIRSYSTPKIKYYACRDNIGIAGGYNQAIAHAQGQYIAIHDSDDISHPQRLAIESTFLSDHPHVGAVSAPFIAFEDSPPRYRRITSVAWRRRCSAERIRSQLLFGRIVIGYNCTAMLRSSVLRQHDIRYDTNLPMAMDTEMLMRFSEVSELVFLNKPLLYYRRHPQQDTANIRLMNQCVWRAVSNLWRERFSICIDEISSDGELKESEQFTRLNVVVEKIVALNINNPAYSTHWLTYNGALFLYRALMSLNQDSPDATYRLYRQTRLLRHIQFNRKFRLYWRAITAHSGE